MLNWDDEFGTVTLPPGAIWSPPVGKYLIGSVRCQIDIVHQQLTADGRNDAEVDERADARPVALHDIDANVATPAHRRSGRFDCCNRSRGRRSACTENLSAHQAFGPLQSDWRLCRRLPLDGIVVKTSSGIGTFIAMVMH
jgi:hypothetical protein